MPDRPDILVVMTDQQRADTLSCLGGRVIETRHLDGLAARGILFERAFAPIPICSPSRASLWTGLHSHRHGVVDNVYGTSDVVRANGLTTVFHRLRTAGYRLAHVGKWHLGEDDPGLFDRWEGYNSRSANWIETDGGGRIYRPEAETDRALALLAERDPATPFCLIVSYQPPHPPYDPPEEEEAPLRPLFPDAPRVAAYYGAARAIDGCVGRLLAGLGPRAEDMAILFCTDHAMLIEARETNHPKRVLFDEALRIPMILALPGDRGAGRRTRRLTSLLDVAPTLLALAGAEPLAEAHGASLLPLAAGDAPWRSRLLLYNRTVMQTDQTDGTAIARTERALRTAREKLVLGYGPMPMIFDLDADPDERRNLLTSSPGIRRAAARAMGEALRSESASIGDQVGVALADDYLRLLDREAAAVRG